MLHIYRTGPLDLPLRMSYRTSSDTAVDGERFVGKESIVMFPAGAASRAVTVSHSRALTVLAATPALVHSTNRGSWQRQECELFTAWACGSHWLAESGGEMSGSGSEWR